MSVSTTIAGPISYLPIVRLESRYFKLKNNVQFNPVGLKPLLRLKPLRLQLLPVERRSITCAAQGRHASLICAAALNATCAAEQTQTVTRQSSTITVAPIQGKEKSPDLDNGGAGFPPRDDDGDGGGGGGGGGHWSGGFFLFGFLAFIGLLKDQESEAPYQEERRR